MKRIHSNPFQVFCSLKGMMRESGLRSTVMDFEKGEFVLCQYNLAQQWPQVACTPRVRTLNCFDRVVWYMSFGYFIAVKQTFAFCSNMEGSSADFQTRCDPPRLSLTSPTGLV